MRHVGPNSGSPFLVVVKSAWVAEQIGRENMGERYKAIVDITYPAPSSLKKVIDAGGLTKMSAEAREKLTFRRVKGGSYADDIPEKSVKWLLKNGLITVTEKRKGKK